MGLLFIQNVIILHVMCMCTHLSSSTIVRSKVSKEVGKAFVSSWVNYYGVPRRILWNTGGEFGSDHFRDLGDVLGIRLDVIGGGAHWALGLMEWRHGILRTLVTKSAQTGKQVPDVMGPVDLVMNSMSTVHGYSPYQLVSGRNTRLPGMMEDGGPMMVDYGEMEGFYGKKLPRHLQSLQTAQEGYHVVE